MKCSNCGFEHEKEFEYCANCGTQAIKKEYIAAETVSLNPAADIVLLALKNKLFLVLCILMTTICALSLAMSEMPLLSILITVFLWLVYADAKKGFANEKHLQFISGVVYAQYIIVNVVSIIFIVCGALFGMLFGSMVEESNYIMEFTKQLEQFGVNSADVSQFISYATVWFIGGIVVFVGVIMLVFNILMMRKIHRFAKSVYMSIMYQNPEFKNPRSVRNWFIFAAVCGGITMLSSIAAGPFAIVSNACEIATTIIVIILLDKYFIK